MIYQVTRQGDGMVAQIEADRYVQDGSGTRFYAADGGTVASFGDGIIGEVIPAGVVFAQPGTGAGEVGE